MRPECVLAQDSCGDFQEIPFAFGWMDRLGGEKIHVTDYAPVFADRSFFVANR